jgi:hypothetical protein
MWQILGMKGCQTFTISNKQATAGRDELIEHHISSTHSRKIPDAGHPHSPNSLWQTLGMKGCLRPTSHKQLHAGIITSHLRSQR